MVRKSKEADAEYMREYRKKKRVLEQKIRENRQKFLETVFEAVITTCPYCGQQYKSEEGKQYRLPGVDHPLNAETVNFLGLLNHVNKYHPDQFAETFYNVTERIKQMYDTLEMGYIKLEEAVAAYNKCALIFREVARKYAKAVDNAIKERDEMKKITESVVYGLQAKVDNVEAKIKGEFKGHAPSLKETARDTLHSKLQDVMRKTAKKEK